MTISGLTHFQVTLTKWGITHLLQSHLVGGYWVFQLISLLLQLEGKFGRDIVASLSLALWCREGKSWLKVGCRRGWETAAEIWKPSTLTSGILYRADRMGKDFDNWPVDAQRRILGNWGYLCKSHVVIISQFAPLSIYPRNVVHVLIVLVGFAFPRSVFVPSSIWQNKFIKGNSRKQWCLASQFLLGISGSSITGEFFRGFNQFKEVCLDRGASSGRATQG